ncbi:MAG TPA: TonB-dependent receptor [Labilithrix sp.]|nr:TonB-dependent receptor [Labilithrix sp.]
MRGEMREILGAVAVAALLSSSRQARADEPEEVIVRAPEAAGFVSRARIEESPREVTDAASLIEPLPGVHVRRLGADDSFATLSVRGTSSTQVAIYLGGVPLSGGADPTLDLATLPLWPGSGVRVYRSFAPAALGRGSLGGTLVLDTPSPRTANGTEVYVAAGAYGSRRVRIGDVSGAPDGVRVATGFSASRSDDDFSYVDPPASIKAGRQVLATRENAGHAAASGLAAIGIPVHLGSGKTGALTILTLAQVRRQQLPGTISLPTRLQRLDSNRLLGALELSLPAGPGAASARAWARRQGLMIHGDPVESAQLGTGPSETSDAIVAAGGSVGWKGRPRESTTLEARLDASGERFVPGRWVGAAQPAGARRTSAGAGADATLRPVDRLTLAASARADTWFDGADDGVSTSETRPAGNVGAEVVLGPVSLATHGGVLARPPSFVERYGDHGLFIGNPGLRPESATTVDAGGTFATKLGGVVRVHLSLAGFATWAEDLIVFIPAGAYGLAKSENIGRARLLGTEAELRAAAHGIELRVSHTALATADETECRVVNGGCERPRLPGRPEHDFVADLAYTLGPVRVRYGVDVVAGIQADRQGAIRVPDRALHSTGARLAVPGAPGLTLALDVRNLFDLRAAHYPSVLPGTDPYPIGDLHDYPIPGRRLLLSARWVFPEPKASASVRAPQ